MTTFTNMNEGHRISNVSKDMMDKKISRKNAIVIYCVGNGFGKFDGFDSYFVEGDTYKTFTNKLMEAGLLKIVD
jgi:hypothetical protein